MANKKDLVDKIATELEGTTKKDIGLILDVAFEKIVETMVSGEEVSIYGFGKFVPVEVPERLARNPQKPDQQVTVPAHRTPKFKAAKALKEAVK